jgi:hypothetical protein
MPGRLLAHEAVLDRAEEGAREGQVSILRSGPSAVWCA